MKLLVLLQYVLNIVHVILYEIRKIAKEKWLKSMDIQPNMNMNCFVIVFNQIYGIVVVGKNACNSIENENDGVCDGNCRNAMHG